MVYSLTFSPKKASQTSLGWVFSPARVWVRHLLTSHTINPPAYNLTRLLWLYLSKLTKQLWPVWAWTALGIECLYPVWHLACRTLSAQSEIWLVWRPGPKPCRSLHSSKIFSSLLVHSWTVFVQVCWKLDCIVFAYLISVHMKSHTVKCKPFKYELVRQCQETLSVHIISFNCLI